ncbi:hypothetical protein FA13DRAFT_1436908 [Coprinellus micaceus]|uniref:Uncharacterized protein n=1 Tax=Coprinellus micaceus TaxID=71717 RepID=A0A4Y7TNC1_COPMI|nr:hypothetical protein FA13DRAFT_1436908 [Coprinellus micaceus]
MSEEVSVVHPQKWNRGKMLYMVIRYGLLAYIVMRLGRGYRNNLIIAPRGCKALLITSEVTDWIAAMTCNLSLGLCLGAVLQANKVLCLSAMLSLSCVRFHSVQVRSLKASH